MNKLQTGATIRIGAILLAGIAAVVTSIRAQPPTPAPPDRSIRTLRASFTEVLTRIAKAERDASLAHDAIAEAVSLPEKMRRTETASKAAARVKALRRELDRLRAHPETLAIVLGSAPVAEHWHALHLGMAPRWTPTRASGPKASPGDGHPDRAAARGRMESALWTAIRVDSKSPPRDFTLLFAVIDRQGVRRTTHRVLRTQIVDWADDQKARCVTLIALPPPVGAEPRWRTELVAVEIPPKAKQESKPRRPSDVTSRHRSQETERKPR